jgi:heme-degrading monooxygenase HmoA
MSLTRIFRVRIDSAYRQQFEEKFSSDVLYKIEEAPGFISASIYKPSKWSPDEYAMISQWQDEASLQAFFGEQWDEPVITSGAEEFVVACWLHHFESWN